MDAVIFDIDGTLSTISKERQELIRKRSWDKFHRLSICAEVNKEVVASLVAHWEAGIKIILLTARPERWRESTIHWLEKNDIPFDSLRMRIDGDKRRSNHSKKEHVKDILDWHNVLEAYDDRQQDIDLFKSFGIKTIKVEGQNEA
jgi:acid phosphatase class B